MFCGWERRRRSEEMGRKNFNWLEAEQTALRLAMSAESDDYRCGSGILALTVLGYSCSETKVGRRKTAGETPPCMCRAFRLWVCDTLIGCSIQRQSIQFNYASLADRACDRAKLKALSHMKLVHLCPPLVISGRQTSKLEMRAI